MDPITRRQALEGSLGMFAAAALTGPVAQAAPSQDRLKIVFAGAHPDDMETGCGGTAARYADQGHEVVFFYLTRGEAGMRGKTHEETGTIRSAEAVKSCEILKARARFFGQIDGSVEVSPARYEEYRKALEEEKPDLVFTWWPINSHRDHRAVFSMVHDAWLRSKKAFTLYYFENTDSQLFQPTHYVDITEVEPRKRAACFSHTWYRDRTDLNLYAGVETLHRARGLQAGFKYAEAFVRHPMNRPQKTSAVGLP